MKVCLLNILLLCLPLATTALGREGDVIVSVPNSVGPVRFEQTEAQILELGPVYEGYHFYRDRAWDLIWVWPDEPTRRVGACLADYPDERPAFLVIRGKDSRYVLPNGLRLGSTIDQLQKLNGKPFALRGVYQEDAGEVLNWFGGALESQLPRVTFFVHPRLDYGRLSSTDIETLSKPLLMSNDAALKKALFAVGQIQIDRPATSTRGPAYTDLRAQEPVFSDNQGRTVYSLTPDTTLIMQTEGREDHGTDSTLLKLEKKGTDGSPEVVASIELDFAWDSRTILTTTLVDGGAAAGLGFAGYSEGGVLSTIMWNPTLGKAQLSLFSAPWGSSRIPAYELLQDERGVLAVRRVWKWPDGELHRDPPEYIWDGESFRFSNGSKYRFGTSYPKEELP